LSGNQVDTKKFPRYCDGQKCGTCLHFKPKAETGGCDFYNRNVPESGWCSGYLPGLACHPPGRGQSSAQALQMTLKQRNATAVGDSRDQA
jgi:hypothetical protein